jgi:hypothetical protein
MNEDRMKCLYEETPKGTFLAVFSDLSGANLFTTLDSGAYLDVISMDEINDVNWFQDAGYLWFVNIDESFATRALAG